MNDSHIQQLGDVLHWIDASPWNFALYLDKVRPWNEETRCAVLDPNDVTDEASDLPEVALLHELQYTLLVSDAQDIVANTTAQKPTVSITDLIQAFNYYYDHDAFIQW